MIKTFSLHEKKGHTFFICIPTWVDSKWLSRSSVRQALWFIGTVWQAIRKKGWRHVFKGLAIIYGQSEMQEYPGKGVTLKKLWVVFTSQAFLFLSDSSHVHSVVMITVMGDYWQSCSSKNVNLVCVFIAIVAVALVPSGPVTLHKKSLIFV